MLDLYTNYVLYSHITKEEKTMGNLIETSLFEEMLEAEEGFEIVHQETEYIHEVNGVTVCEQLEDFLERENGELRQLEMEAELSVGI